MNFLKDNCLDLSAVHTLVCPVCSGMSLKNSVVMLRSEILVAVTIECRRTFA